MRSLRPALAACTRAEPPQQLTVADVNGMAAHAEGQWSAEEEQELLSICTNEAYRAVGCGTARQPACGELCVAMCHEC